MRKSNVFLSLSLSVLAVACASTPTEREVTGGATRATAPSIEAQQVAAEQEASHVAEITFAKNSSSLSETSKSKLAEMIRNARRAGEIEEIKLITWADSEYPSVHTKKLSQTDRKLVRDRNEGLEKHLKNLDREVDVRAYSMAERPGTLAELIGSSDARIKKSLETAGVPTTDTTVKVPSKASKSIVLVIVDPHETN